MAYRSTGLGRQRAGCSVAGSRYSPTPTYHFTIEIIEDTGWLINTHLSDVANRLLHHFPQMQQFASLSAIPLHP
ncbi:MAG: hypothetical protein HC893_10670 [Chloroflexaceae bacterium]|nr:hypothetical protein [Chloroflexaceae bacterium]